MRMFKELTLAQGMVETGMLIYPKICRGWQAGKEGSSHITLHYNYID
jgi:hypothetical protein